MTLRTSFISEGKGWTKVFVFLFNQNSYLRPNVCKTLYHVSQHSSSLSTTFGLTPSHTSINKHRHLNQNNTQLNDSQPLFSYLIRVNKSYKCT